MIRKIADRWHVPVSVLAQEYALADRKAPLRRAS
jgi:hypothetical protein